MAVKSIAIPGAIASDRGDAAGHGAFRRVLGWSIMTGIVFGLCLSTASTAVVLRALEERQLIDSQRGQIAIGWLIVENSGECNATAKTAGRRAAGRHDHCAVARDVHAGAGFHYRQRGDPDHRR